MKRLCILFILVTFILCFPIKTTLVFADISRGNYLRVIDNKTPFYTSVYDSTPLFYLPYTYYVKVIDELNGFMHVECYGNNNTPSIDGFVPSSYLYNDGLNVVEPYLDLYVTTLSTAPLYLDAQLTNRIQYVFKDRTLSYYGHFESNGKILYYVGYNDKLGYVEENFLVPFVINNHPNELTFLAPNPPIVDNESGNENSTNDQTLTIKIAIISCLIFAGLIALIFIMKNTSETKKPTEYYDQNDFE